MKQKSNILERFLTWSEKAGRMTDTAHHREFFMRELPGLLKDREAVEYLLKAIADGSEYPDVRSATIFESEVVLYRDPWKLFSVRLYLWGPGDYDPVHDHNSWGVIGTALGTLDVINYERLDDGTSQEHAVLMECSRQAIPTGRTYSVFPLDRGIHRTGNAGEPAIVQVGVYGANITGRPYVNVFDLHDSSISRLYLPHVRKRMLAGKALETIRAV